MLNFDNRWKIVFETMENILDPKAIDPVECPDDLDTVIDRLYNDDDFCASLFKQPNEREIVYLVEQQMFIYYKILL